ncbi:MAG: head-tail connector protein [Fusobacterium gastrosuis]|uniref:head-tail connector protein n=1 Tax=Fusobacterium gastrosuis TaxID=1755100 RepID=UPI002A872CDF|nr:head-tail connector protein [Fusobacterium gastrosuis]
MSFLNLEDTKNYLRIDYDTDDVLLETLMSSAEHYLSDAISDFESKITKNKFKERTKILGYVLVQEWYDNRELRENKDVSYTVRSLLTQLQVSDFDE